VESVAENTVDGIISPLFYACLGGPALAWAYKAINTLDSMIGYKDERYLHFGWFSARLDDAANFIPARLSALIIPLAAFLIGQDAILSLKTVRADGRHAESPNAGFPESAFAGALRIQLGGDNIYRGRVASRPLIGQPMQPRKPEHIKRAIRLMYAASFVAVLMAMIGLGV
jgi:adenosylcobinamide-phosphate synthase